MASMFKKTEVELELLTDIDMLLMVEKGIRRGICHAIFRYAKANSKYMQYLDANNLYGWAMFQPLPVDGFKFVKNVSKIDEESIKNYDEDFDIFLKYMLNILKIYMICMVIYLSYQKE